MQRSMRHEERHRSSSTRAEYWSGTDWNESLFFASANALTLDSLRLGAKWAFKARDALQMAPAA